jgi:Flp pilus assembly protein TadG
VRDLIIGLARPMMRLLHRDERGAIGVIVAVLLGSGVLMGLGALVIDVGQLYQERAQLQNGADAAAIAVADSCASGTCNTSLATSYANGNAVDGTSGVNRVCGSATLSACPASTGTMYDCPSAPAGQSYVDVQTATRTSDGGTLLPPVFSRTLAGQGNYQGSTVYACAQAIWGGPTNASTVAFTISACEWDQATNNGTAYAQPPPYPPNTVPSASLDQQLKVHSTSGTGCSNEPAGSDGPGIFGWTSDQTGNCGINVSNGTYTADTGVSAGQTCQTVLANAQANRTVLYVPVYTTLTMTGSNGTFTLKGFAAFVVTGYHLSGFNASDWLNPKNDCKGSTKCINGYFTTAVIPTTGPAGGPNLGASVVKLTG